MRRPQNMSLCDYIEWVINNELKDEPEDLEKDCWVPSKSKGRIKGDRVIANWEGRQMPMYQLTYMAWNEIEENPFSQELHASHSCNNPECVNPLHIVPEDASANEKRKLELPGAEMHKQMLRKKQLELREQGKICPTGLTHKERAQWYLDNKTWLDTESELVNGSHCMRYTGGLDTTGYARTDITVVSGKPRKKVQVHRYVYCMLNDLPYGEDPNDPWNAKGVGFSVADHICNQPSCINPDHIQLISRSENSLRSNTKARKITEEDARAIIEEFLSISEWPLGSKAAFGRKWGEKLGVSMDVPNGIVFGKRSWKPLLIEYGLL
jgi:hypothetical protein